MSQIEDKVGFLVFYGGTDHQKLGLFRKIGELEIGVVWWSPYFSIICSIIHLIKAKAEFGWMIKKTDKKQQRKNVIQCHFHTT